VNPAPEPKADTRVLATLRAHSEREQAVVAAYRRLAENSNDEAIAYLARIVIDDEERHHRVLEEMANRLESWIEGRTVGRSTPALVPRVDRELLDATHELISLEHDDAKELRLLQRELRYAPATSLLSLLVELMLHDTEKHIEILHFIRTYSG
jgi:hypothetical protein